MNRPWNNPVSFDIDKKYNKYEDANNYRALGMRLIGLRLYTADDCDRELVRHVKCMQKSLYGKTDWFYFYKGFELKDVDTSGKIEVMDSAFDANFYIYGSKKEMIKDKTHKIGKHRLSNISVSAVVGQNGTGKSTLIDMVIRVLNNLSAATFGENFIYTSAQHLHYIENVYASLAVYIDDKIQILTVKGRDMYLDTFERHDDQFEENNVPEKIVYDKTSERIVILRASDHPSTAEVLDGNNENHKLLKEWFYTIISNYSLYAYNYNDYFYEESDARKIEALRPQMDDVPGKEDRYWLKGVFHKNDGYQTPIVINPMREKGYINAKKENLLGKQNLISLSFVRVKFRDYDGITHPEDPFRIINKTHKTATLLHTWTPVSEYEGFRNTYYDGKKILEGEARKQIDSLERAYKCVQYYWAKKLGLCKIWEEFQKLISCNNYMKLQAWDYAVYKTFRVFGNYRIYKDDYKFFAEEFDEKTADEHLDKLLRDSTHRTRKLRRVLTFIKFFSEHYSTRAGAVDIDDVYDWMMKHVGEELYEGKLTHNHSIEVEDLLPPPCCDVAVGLVELDKWEQYKREREKFMDIVPFEGLSSGERQIAYTIGNLLYHAINIDSTVDDVNGSKEHFDTIHYEHLNILMDEVELYYHPDLQRRFVKLLVDAFHSMTWKHIDSVNIMLITHSPFVLSDVPDTNLLCLSRDDRKPTLERTFAANIHDMFNNTFILPDTIGEMAGSLIREFAELYNQQVKWWHEQDNKYLERTIDTTVYKQFIMRRDQFEYLCQIVGDEYLHEELTDMFEELSDFYLKNAHV